MCLKILFCSLLLVICLHSFGMESDSEGDELSSISKALGKFTSTPTIPNINRLLEKGKTLWSNESLNIFPFASGQGNFILLKYRYHIMVLDGGTQTPGFSAREAFSEGKSPSSWNEFLARNNDILSEIFSQAKISAVLVTHPDSDHYDWLGGLFDFAVQKNENKILEGVKFFFGGYGKEFQYCQNMRQCENCSFYIRIISHDCVFEKIFGTQIKILDRTGIAGVKDPWVIWELNKNEDTNCDELYNNDKIEGILHDIMQANISILSPIPIVKTASDNNSNSLVVSVNFGVGTVLFTGDATGNTLNAVYGDTKNPDLNISAVSIRNRNLLKRVNFLIAPHHGSETEGSPFWLSQIIKLSSNSFVGTIFCAPHVSQFQHPNRYIDTISFPASAISWPHEIGYYREDKKRLKMTDHSIFITSFAKYGTYWLNLLENGMFMFSDESGELERLISKKGWSMHTDRLLNLGNEDCFDAFLPIALHNPQELSVRNAKGETPFLQLLRSEPINEKSIKNMLIVSLFKVDANTDIGKALKDLLKAEYDKNLTLYNAFSIKGMTLEKSLSFLFKKIEITEKDLKILESLNDSLIKKVLPFLMNALFDVS